MRVIPHRIYTFEGETLYSCPGRGGYSNAATTKSTDNSNRCFASQNESSQKTGRNRISSSSYSDYKSLSARKSNKNTNFSYSKNKVEKNTKGINLATIATTDREPNTLATRLATNDSHYLLNGQNQGIALASCHVPASSCRRDARRSALPLVSR